MRRTIVVLGILGLIGFIGYRTLIGEQTVSWHQRLTVIVETPNGEVRGASVIEVTKTNTNGLLVPREASGVSSRVHGEAVAVEVLPGRWMFALLSSGVNYKGNADQLVYSAFRLGAGRAAIEQSYEADMAELLAQPLDTPAVVPPEAYPMLVTFDDITKPETVREVDPADMAATFGLGVTLHGMTLEVTDEGLKEDRVEGVLRWLCNFKRDKVRLNGKSGAISDNLLSNNLGADEFKMDTCK